MVAGSGKGTREQCRQVALGSGWRGKMPSNSRHHSGVTVVDDLQVATEEGLEVLTPKK